jgi:hypothetical protein
MIGNNFGGFSQDPISKVSLIKDGNEITFATDSQRALYDVPRFEYVLLTGLSGFGMTPVSVRFDDSASDGAVFRTSKHGVRDIIFPVAIFADSTQVLRACVSKLAGVLKNDSSGIFLRVDFGSESRVLTVFYVGGGDVEFGEDHNGVFAKWLIQLQAPQPFWNSLSQVSFLVNAGLPKSGFVRNLTKLAVNSSQVFGDVVCENPGEAPAYPFWDISGPVENLTISSGSKSFTFVKRIEEGQNIRVECETGVVKEVPLIAGEPAFGHPGVNRYDMLGPVPKLFSISPGSSNIQVSGEGCNDKTKVTCSFAPRYEVVY